MNSGANNYEMTLLGTIMTTVFMTAVFMTAVVMTNTVAPISHQRLREC